ncbi:pyridoxal phosphate-dependent transferase [Chloropicon primus]|uniref:Pyridoxal phosphate-dependent transferase n=1 Tax=Chloropicon primus TaxID=1764295 RepID=A0A5B8MU53_9CHLO|nr:pyridoxal phosphate-dependent transferase [Chloropicon primus]|eukprot:QDZ23897.1 pyridoxal phosphate-dependent transferase [Chloropicon primus]
MLGRFLSRTSTTGRQCRCHPPSSSTCARTSHRTSDATRWEERRRVRLVSTAMASSVNEGGASVSRRILSTDSPVVVQMKKLIAEGGRNDEVLSLAQGVVHWSPPSRAKQMALESLRGEEVHAYGACEGLPALREALKKKLLVENKLEGVDVMVTTGANQAFMNALLSVADSNDNVVLFVPYYFNHLMALQMTEGGPGVDLGPCDPQTMLPDLGWLERRMKEGGDIKAVVVVTPNNPSGVIIPRAMLVKMADLCEAANAWFIVDNTYENFVYEDTEVRPEFVSGPNVINIFSFSKAYGMMGWRMGYLSYCQSNRELSESLLKAQDTIPICPAQISQHMALGALEAGSEWVKERVKLLEGNRKKALDALSPLGDENITKSQGAIYLWAKLPRGLDDAKVVERLVKEFKVCIIPGSSCGSDGHIRVAYANLTEEECSEACARLKRGLTCILS